MPCCCGCCNRDITEISFVTLFGSFLGTTTGGCNDIGSDTKTWTRINLADVFDGSRQFKLWLDSGCNPNVQFNGSLFGGFPHLTYTAGAFSNGNVTIFNFDFSGVGPLTFHLQYIVSASTCIVGSCDSTFNVTSSPFSTCDWSSLIGIYTTSNSCDAGDLSWHTEVAATITIS